MQKNLVIWPANINDLIPKIQVILKMPEFCGQEFQNTGRLKGLLEKFNADIRFVIEFPYVDRHYRDTYYSYHSSKFKKTGRNCIRVHLFEGEVTEAHLLNRDNNLDKKYCGFFIIRPLALVILGRSLISPKAFKENKFVCCIMQERVSLLGNEFMANGFPHIAQDEETHTCAESALWSHIEYFGSKYPQYKPLLPSQIIKTLLDNTEHRLLPSKGLTKVELAKCLQNNGFQCQVYTLDDAKKRENRNFQMLQIYIESGIPLLLVLGGSGQGHAVLAIGHQEDDSIYDNPKKQPFPEGSSWADVSYFNKKLVLIDDNVPPYQSTDMFTPAAHYSNQELHDMEIKSFIASLPVHMYLIAEKAYAMMEKTFNADIVGLNSKEGKWITRFMLTGSHSFKNFICKTDVKLTPELRRALLHLPMPRFIWISEVYKEHEFVKDGYCSGLLIIDATSDGKSLASVLWYAVDTDHFIHDNVSWEKEGHEKIPPFRLATYRNNLKGEWIK